MKSAGYAAAIALFVALPMVSHAQSTAGKTRAEVRAELVELEAAGFHPGVSNPNYPRDIQAAEIKVNAEQSSDFGGGTSGSGQAGRPADFPPAPGKTQRNPLGIYFGD